MSDLREQLKAAMSGGEPPEAVVTPEVAPVEAAAAGKVEKVEGDAPLAKEGDKPAGARDRDDTGKFKAAATPSASPAEPVLDAAPAAEANPPPEEPIRVPPSLPAALKAKFSELSPEWREAFTKRDEDVNTAKAQWDTKAQRLNRLDEIIAPHKDAWAVQGLEDHQALSRLVSAEKVLRETPAQGILYLAQSYGVDLRQLVGGQDQQQAPAPVVDPAFQSLQTEIQTLKDTLAQQSQSASQASLATAQAQINEFATNPANLYFENVRDDVADRLQGGKAKTLAEAYEQAIWASPEIRPLLLAEQSKAATAKATEDAARAKATAAKAASGSVTGAPTPGAVPANAGPKGSIREELMAARQEHAARL